MAGVKKTVTTLKMLVLFARVPIGRVTVWPFAAKGTLSTPRTRPVEGVARTAKNALVHQKIARFARMVNS